MSKSSFVKWTLEKLPFFRQAMYQGEVLKRLETRAVEAERIISTLKQEVEELKRIVPAPNISSNVLKLQEENEQLKKEIEVWKGRLISLEVAQRVQQIPLPSSKQPSPPKEVSPAPSTPTVERASPAKETPISKPATKPEKTEKVKKEKEKAAPKKAKGGDAADVGSEPPVDVGRLDLRIGRIINVKKHPDADSLYVEEVDVGEEKLRTVVSGLVKFVPQEEMENRMVVLLCNLKPAKMRGITSEAMVMCASTPEKVEILIPPEGSVPGDQVHVEGFPRVPDAVLNPKKKIFETVAPDLKTNDQKIATYKDASFTVPGKGVVTSPSLVGVNIK